jgi:Zn-dependent peptidase ImmA (M78 family)
MDRIQLVNPGRIAWCCSDRRITTGELAKAVNMAATTMEKVMMGEPCLTFGQLNRIAEYFGRGVLFFLEKEPVDEAQVHTPQFRSIENQKPGLSPSIRSLIERAQQQRRVYLSLREDLDDAVPKFTSPDIAGLQLKDAALKIRKWLKLGSENSFDAYRAAVEAKGMLVFRSNGYNGKWQIPKQSPILGFSLFHDRCPLVVVKKQDAPTRQTFTLMHELGHLLLHQQSFIDDEDDFYSQKGKEREANAFAGYLLVPDKLLQNISDNEKPREASQFDDWLSVYRKAWGVSTEVILRRLLDSKRLTQADYSAFREWQNNRPVMLGGSGSRAYRHREPKHVFGDTYVRTVLDALSGRHITLTRASKYLDSLKIKDLHKLEQFYAGN